MAGRKPIAQRKILNALAVVENYMTCNEIATLADISRMHTNHTLKNLLSSGYVKRVLRGQTYYWLITDSGRQEYSRLEQIYGIIPTNINTQLDQEIENRDISVRCLDIVKNREQESKVVQSFREERDLRANEHGIRRYFLYDLTNPIDAEIVRRIREKKYDEYFCRQILCKRLSLHSSVNYFGIDQLIEQALLKRCLKNGKTRNEYVRELFCIQLDIKEGFEGVQTSTTSTYPRR